MTGDTIQRRLSLRVTFHAEAHVDFYDRHDSIHSLHRSVTVLTSDARVDVRAMREPHEIRQGINAVPANFEGRLAVVVPGTGDRLDAAGGATPVASDAAGDRRNARVFGSPRVLVTVLTGNFIYAGVDPMAEWNRLDHVGAWQPGPLRKRDDADSAEQQEGGQGQDSPVHLGIQRSNCGRTRSSGTSLAIGPSVPI
jgi:hypothetical protein